MGLIILEIIISIIISVILTILLKFDSFECLATALLCTIFIELVKQNYKLNKLYAKIGDMDNLLSEIRVLSCIQEKMNNIKNPYFKKWANIKINKFLEENADFFEGSLNTNPYKEDTFGKEGLKYTKKGGCIKAVSSVLDYWEDEFAKGYIKMHKELIKNRVEITRIFILPTQNDLKHLRKTMINQKRIGIKVYYILCDNPYIKKEWRYEDFIIQDNSLLVQINYESHKYKSDMKDNEHITLNKAELSDKIELFEQMLNRAKKF